jgi:signal transduction histidine kinase
MRSCFIEISAELSQKPRDAGRRTPGNGLGLSLVAAVARLHGASVEMRTTRLVSNSESGFRRARDRDAHGGRAAVHQPRRNAHG